MGIRSKSVVAALIVTMTFGAGVASADGINELIEVALNKVNVEINGVKMESDNILYNGRTYVQLKEVCDALGKELSWNGETFTASINNKADDIKPNNEASNHLEIPSGYDVIATNKAKFVGEVTHKSGDRWYKAESKYTDVYFFNEAVEMEWVMEDIDAQFEYLLNFRNLVWDGYKLPIYFYGEDNKLSSDSGYYGSAYTLDKQVISMSADHQYETIDYQYTNGKRVTFKEDPRHTLVHEMSHHLNHPDKLKVSDKWLEEGFAYYLSYNYDFKDVDTTKYPDYINRKFTDFVFTNSEKYSVDNWLNYLKNEEFKNYSKKGISNILTFEGIAKSHYGMLEEKSPSARYIEPIVIEYMIETYGKEKFLELYTNINIYKNYFNLESEIKNVYGKSIKELEAEFRAYTDLESYYITE